MDYKQTNEFATIVGVVGAILVAVIIWGTYTSWQRKNDAIMRQNVRQYLKANNIKHASIDSMVVNTDTHSHTTGARFIAVNTETKSSTRYNFSDIKVHRGNHKYHIKMDQKVYLAPNRALSSVDTQGVLTRNDSIKSPYLTMKTRYEDSQFVRKIHIYVPQNYDLNQTQGIYTDPN